MPRPAQASLDRLFRQLQDEPSHGPGGFRFPKPRPRKPEDVPLGQPIPAVLGGPGGVGGAIPFRHFWPFYAAANAGNLRSTCVSPVYTGPLLVENLYMGYGRISGDGAGISLSYKLGSATQVRDAASTSLPGGVQLWDRVSYLSAFQTDGDEIAGNLPNAYSGAYIHTPVSIPMGLRVDEQGPIVLILSIRSGPGTACDMSGAVQLSERVDFAAALRPV